MKTLIKLKFSLCILVLNFFFIQSSDANWKKSETSVPQIPQEINSEYKEKKKDSLPEGVTEDWLNSIIDENGKRIIAEKNIRQTMEYHESDAMQRKIFNGYNTGDRFGNSVSTAGDVNGDGYSDLIVGAPNYSSDIGRVYIYLGGLTMGMFNDTADVVITGEAVNSDFGFQVSSAGDVNGDGYSDVIVGAPNYSSNTGRAYIYFGGAVMNNVADVIMTGETAGSQFGSSVSSAGDVNDDGYDDVIAGAPSYSTNTGRVYVFFGGALMNNAADVIMSGEATGNFFGRSVSTAGDVNGDGYSDVIAGARGFSSNTGRAYVFLGGAVMNNAADVIMTGEAAGNFFGRSVSSAGDVNGDGYSDVIAGADRYSSDSGRAYVFYGGAVMNNAADVTMTGEASSNSFGWSVSSAGDVNGDGYSDVIVGADGYSANTGRAYVYFGSAVMNTNADVIMTGEAAGDRFGFSVSSAGDVNNDGYSEVTIGAFGNSSNTGRAYIYDYFLRNEIISDITFSGEQATSDFGFSVSSAGDLNGDGYSDVIIGAYGNYFSDTGRVYIFFGGAVMNNVADLIMKGPSSNDRFGYSVSSAGDLNGDGYSDVIVGSDGWSPLTVTDKIYIYFGGAVMNNVADVIIIDQYPSELGVSVSSAGDVNGDGYSDVIIGIPNITGNAYIYFGGASMDNSADVTMTGQANSLFGLSVSEAGDVNGDGYSDVIVGAPADQFTSVIGKAYVYFGGAVMNNSPDVTMSGEAAGHHFGISVSTAGDVNGDGYSDVIIGAERHSMEMGKAYIFFGGAVMNNSADVILTDTGVNRFGNSVSSIGDINADGYGDVIVGASRYSSLTGRAYVYFGGAVMNNSADIIMTGDTANNQFGTSVSSAGDMNGDGYPDIIVGAPYTLPAGKAYIYLASSISLRPTLNLTMFIEGFYNSGIDKQIKDTITAELRNSASPYAVVDQTSKIVSANGTVQLRFFNASVGNYYIALKHRNSIETWSAGGISMNTGIPVNYNLSSSSSQAYGSNQIQVDSSPMRFGIYSGDVNQDGVIDIADGSLIDNDAFNFESGYLPTDVNGDGVIDLADAVFADNNSFNFIGKITP